MELVSAFVSLLVASVTAFTCTDYIRSFASLINVKQAILIFLEFSLNFSHLCEPRQLIFLSFYCLNEFLTFLLTFFLFWQASGWLSHQVSKIWAEHYTNKLINMNNLYVYIYYLTWLYHQFTYMFGSFTQNFNTLNREEHCSSVAMIVVSIELSKKKKKLSTN